MAAQQQQWQQDKTDKQASKQGFKEAQQKLSSIAKQLAKDRKEAKLMTAVGKPARWTKERCRCGNKMKYACVIQCEPCWQEVVRAHEEYKAMTSQAVKEALERRKAAQAEEALWAPAFASAAQAAQTSGAPVLATAQGVINEIERTQQRFCKCGKLIKHPRFKECWGCHEKTKQLKTQADESSEKLEQALKAEIASKQRELAKMQLKEADEAFKMAEALENQQPWGEDSQSD